MPSDFELRGLDDLSRLASAMREAGSESKGLKRELRAGLNRETKRTRKEMREAILPGLPRRGGLAADVQSKTRFTTTVSTSERTLGVRIKAASKRSIRRMNATGSFRHPVFGSRSTWATQSTGVTKGFLDKPFEKSRPDLQKAVVEAVNRVRDQIYRSI
jgi:hypothetical protein